MHVGSSALSERRPGTIEAECGLPQQNTLRMVGEHNPNIQYTHLLILLPSLFVTLTTIVNSSRLREISKRRDGLVRNLIKLIQNIFRFWLPDFSFYCRDRAALSIGG